jgi:hypothetical protein
MSCECYQIGGPWITFDPQCEAHGYEAQAREREQDMLHTELKAWRTRFPQYVYRPQDDTISLKLEG